MAQTPQFFHLTAGRNSFEGSITTLMANVIVSEPGASHRAVRPYASGGVGLLRFHIKEPADGFDLRHRDFGFNLGAGLMISGKHVGIRGDVRYFRDLQGVTADNDLDLDFVDLTFMRATVGAVFRF